ncbi:galactose oxidase [Chloropicon primus]|nr:galactose oxidase [Chloropicon primus]
MSSSLVSSLRLQRASMASPTMEYPDKFHKAKAYVQASRKRGEELADETQLVLYALDRERALWQAWDHLGQMSREEAMRLYVKQLEIDVPRWWSQVPVEDELGQEIIVNGGYDDDVGVGEASASSCECSFELLRAQPGASGALPKPRYEHGSLCIGSKAYVIGGRWGGRYLNDCWSLDLPTRTWSERKWRQVDQSNKTVLPALAAASYLHTGGFKCVVMGGHTKPDDRTDDLKVYKVDLSSMEVERCDSFGDNIPSARGGHASVLVRFQVYVFGGEETNTKKLRNDLYVYDLHSSTWTLAETKGEPPSPRSAHSMTVVDDKYIVVFGGGSVSRCFNDLYVLDLQSMEWFQPDIVEDAVSGLLPEPRAGHAAAMMSNGSWVIVGGGNNVRACTDAFVMDLSNLGSQGRGVWISLGELGGDVMLSCEGATLVETDTKGTRALAYGGYDGKYLDRLCALHLRMRKTATGSEKKPREAPLEVGREEASAGQGQSRSGEPSEPSGTVAPASAGSEHSELAALKAELAAVKAKLKQETQKSMRLVVENAELKQMLADLEEDALPVSTMDGGKAQDDEYSNGGVAADHQAGGGGGWLSYITGES